MDMFGYKKPLRGYLNALQAQNEQLAYALNFDHGKCNYLFSS